MRYAIPLTAALFFSAAGTSLAADGPALYKQHCASCHGATGRADTPASKALNVPPLAGNGKLAGESEAHVAAKIRSKPKHAAVLKKLNDDDVQALAVFVRQLATSQ
jgi:mono/diheme cytochrome c family protein